MKIWGKTLLTVYRYLETLSNAIDNIVLKNSINAGASVNGKKLCTYDIANKIMELSERKCKIINLKVIIEDALKGISYPHKRLLILTYLDNVKSVQVAERMNVSIRTFFRNKNNAIVSFSKQLRSMGYSSEKLESMFGKEQWLMNVYYNTMSKQITEESTESINLNKIIKDLSFLLPMRKFSYV